MNVSTDTPLEENDYPTGTQRASAPDILKRAYDKTPELSGTDERAVVNGKVIQSSASFDPIEEERVPDDLAQKLVGTVSEVASFAPLQEWDGYVVEVMDDKFRARLTDITGVGRPDEVEVEIPLDELDEDSQAQLGPGRLFRWSIGYQRSHNGTKTRVSMIIVRRLPAWSKADKEAAERDARDLAKKLKWE